jgi:hypothetical protein
VPCHDTPQPTPIAGRSKKAERCDPLAEVHEEVAGLLRRPCAAGVGGDSEDVHARVATSMTNSTYSRWRKIVSTWKKSLASRPLAWVRKNTRQEASRWRGVGPVAAGPQDPPHGCLAHVVTEADEFPMHPAVPPGRVLPR